MKNKYLLLDIFRSSGGNNRMKTIKEIRAITGLSQTAFGERYHIPMRTIQNWEGGQRECPEYVRLLLERVVKEDFERN